jgi:hypothetical protein
MYDEGMFLTLLICALALVGLAYTAGAVFFFCVCFFGGRQQFFWSIFLAMIWPVSTKALNMW